MKKEKCLEIVSLYRKFFQETGVKKSSYSHHKILDTSQHSFEHCHSMLDKMEEFIHEGRLEKFFRWLGFIQGVLWTSGIYPLEELKNHNKPVE